MHERQFSRLRPFLCCAYKRKMIQESVFAVHRGMITAIVKHAQTSISPLADDTAPRIQFIMRPNQPDQFPKQNVEHTRHGKSLELVRISLIKVNIVAAMKYSNVRPNVRFY